MAAVGLSHYNIKAPRTQLRQLRDFYCQMVGLVEGPRPPIKRFGYWLYAGDDAVLHLIEIPDEEAAQTIPSAAIDHVAFDCSDFDEMKQRLDAGGVPYRISEVPESKERQIFFKDVTGSGVELKFAADPSCGFAARAPERRVEAAAIPARAADASGGDQMGSALTDAPVQDAPV